MKVANFFVCVAFTVFFFGCAIGYEFVATLIGSDRMLETSIAGRALCAFLGVLYSVLAVDGYTDIKKKK